LYFAFFLLTSPFRQFWN